MTSCWIVTDKGKPGTEKQCIALAEALKLDPHIYRLESRWPWSFLPPALWFCPLKGISPSLTPPWPEVIIGAGRKAAAPTAALKKATGNKAFAIFLQNPHLPLSLFDVVIAPLHDQLKGKNVISTLGALHGMTSEKLKKMSSSVASLVEKKPHPWGVVLLGGNSRHFKMTPDRGKEIASQLQKWHSQKGGTLFVTPSRRTPSFLLPQVEAALSPEGTYIWKGEGENPYEGFLGIADYFIVTADSVSMICEAAGTGKPIFILDLPTSSDKFQEFHERLRSQGISRLLDTQGTLAGPLQEWSYHPLQETQDCAHTLSLLLSHAGHKSHEI